MNLPKKWRLVVHGAVVKVNKKLPISDQTKINEVIKLLPENVFAGDALKVQGEENVWRRRIGQYRLFYELHKNEGIVFVFRLERRSSKTY